MNPKKLLGLGATLVAALTLAQPRLAAVTVNVFWDDYEQKIYGFGGNIALGGETVVESYSLYDEIFSASGLNVSVLRVPNWHDMRSQSTADYDAKVVGVATTMKKFRAMKPRGTILMTAWTPPPYLKVNDRLKPASNGDVNNRIKPYTNSSAHNYHAYAWWWVNSLRFYRDFGGANQGTLPDYVSIQNEPDNNVASWESCLFTPYEDATHASYSRALATTRDVLDANGFSEQKLAGPDISELEDAGSTTPDASKFFSYVNRNGETNPNKVNLGDIDAIAHHIYGDKSVATLRSVQYEFPFTDVTLPKFQTEYKIGGANNMVAPKVAEDFIGPARHIHNSLRHEKVNAYLVWDLVWGCVTPKTNSAGQKYVAPNNGEYYALGHYSKFINPNDWCINTADEGGVWATAYRQYTGQTTKDRLIVVLINTNDSAVNATIVGKKANGASYDYWDSNPSARKLTVYRTSGVGTGAERLKKVEAITGSSLDGLRTVNLPAESITTVLIE